LTNNILHLSQVGDAEGYLIRRKHLSVITEGLNEDGQPNNFTNIASGDIEADDILVFCSTRLLRYITKHDLSRIFATEGNIEKELCNLKDLLGIETLDQMGITAVKTKESKEKKTKGFSRFSFTEVLTTIKNNPLIDKIKNRGKKIKKEDNEAIETHNETASNIATPKSSGFKKGISNKVKGIKSLISKISNKKEDSKITRKKQILAAMAGVIFVLIISIVIIRFSGAKQQMINDYEKVLTEVQSDIENASTIGITDKKKAAEILKLAEEKTNNVLQSGYLRGAASQRLDNIQEIKEKLDSIKKIENPKILADLVTAKSTVNAIGFMPYLDHFVAYEPTGILEIILDKIEKPKNIDDGEEMIDGAYFEDQKALVFTTKSNKIVEYKEGQFQYITNGDGKWKPAADLKAFSSKIYLLDTVGNQIWKYTRRRDNYSTADKYITEADIDLSKAIDITIDGSVYVLNKDGSIERYYGGIKEKLLIRKEPLSELVNPTKIYTEFEMQQLYILEPSSQRVLVYNKEPKTGNLTYIYQVKFPELKNIRDFHIDKGASKIYVLDSNKIYESAL
ncbi:hypothetical protein KKG71_04010, partial [Patescibacteria group bacterium]|nr:hypothetical protein [Patescibacteria group bacterium]